jgi:hypothetical protein
MDEGSTECPYGACRQRIEKETGMLTLRRWRKASVLVFTAVFLIATAGSSFAATTWQKNHPRRAQVNSRLANQNRRIHQERKEGELTGKQAAKLHREDHQIRQEERLMASQNGGHITKSEQRTLNQQENTVSKQIGQ